MARCYADYLVMLDERYHVCAGTAHAGLNDDRLPMQLEERVKKETRRWTFEGSFPQKSFTHGELLLRVFPISIARRPYIGVLIEPYRVRGEAS